MKAQKPWQKALWILLILAGLWAFSVLLLPVFLPFLIGLLLALIARKPILLLQKRLKLPRWAASFLCVLLLLALIFAAVFLLCKTVCRELSSFLHTLPENLSALTGPLLRLENRLYALADRLPDGIGTGLHEGLRNFFESGAGLSTRLYERLFTFASGFLGKVPDLFLFLVTAILSGFMLACELPKISEYLTRKLPQSFLEKSNRVWQNLKTTFGAWLKAQAKLMGITFLIMTLGLMILNTAYPLLFALIVTLIDALPVFGTGIVLIPWSLLSFLQADTRRGIGFLILYGTAALTRQTLEPRLVGQQIGLAPILTLAALYAGYRVMGVLGMLLFPIAAILLKQFWEHSGLQNAG